MVFGDLVTNRLASTAFSGIQRDSETSPCANNRYIFANVGTVGVVLAPGTYWLDWMTDGNLSSGPWAPPITVIGETTTGNALQYTTAWAPALDSGTSTQQGMPFIVEGTIVGAVPNDECSNAKVITTTPYNDVMDTTEATTAPDDPSVCGAGVNSNSVWYSFTAPEDGLVSAETCGSGYDTVLAILEGPCGEPWTEVACNDDSCGLQSELIDIPVVEGVTYLIEVMDYGNPGGGPLDFTFDFTPTGQPPDIRIEPEAFEEMLCPDQQLTVEMLVCNDGGEALEWALVETPGPPNAGGISAGGAPQVTLPDGYPRTLTQALKEGLALPAVEPVAPNLGGGVPEALSFYYDRGVFDGDFPGLPVEDYEDGGLVPGDVLGFGHPLDENTDNGIFSPGDILPGIQIWATVTHADDELVGLGETAFGAPSDTVLANYFADGYRIVFDPPVQAAGMDLQDFMGSYSCQIDVYAPGAVYLGSDVSACNEAGVFWGVTSDTDPIEEIVITDLGGGAEGADNIAFAGGEPPYDLPWLSEDPTEGYVLPGECQVVNVTFDSTGLDPGYYYQGELLVYSSDPDEPETSVPVILYVSACGETMFAKVRLQGRTQGGTYVVAAVARVKSAEGVPIEGAEVTMFLKKPNGNTNMQMRLTNMNGRALFPMASPIGGYWLACIEDVQHPFYVWDDSGPKCDFLEFPAP